MKHSMYIDGKWVKGQNFFLSINPATEDTIAEFPSATSDDMKRAVDSAEAAFDSWKSTPAPKRALCLQKIAQLLRERKEELARTETQEMGKVLKEARGDVQEAIDVFDYMAGEGRRLFGHTTTSELQKKFAMTLRQPIGVCGLITPWNFPIAIPAWKISAALVCGNTVVFKPSSDTPLCAMKLVEVIEKAGVPPGVVNFVTGSGKELGKEITSNKKIRCISFTGSKETGEWIIQNAGLKKVGLELGGKNGIIVMDDANLRLAAEGVIWGAFGTTGQRCTAASRVIVHTAIKDKFEKMLWEKAKALRLGDGLKDTTDVGPLVNKQAVEKVESYAQIGREEGAKLICGGKRTGLKGYFFEPTIFSNVQKDMRIAQEEIFGPILSIIEIRSIDEAINVMNGIEYGLSSSIYTQDINKAMTAVEQIEAGITYVNSSTIGAEVHLPFGGIKHTGHGREGGILGIDEFSEMKTVYIDYSGKLQKAQIDD
ncbi:MAG: aldehyde dehydrogenase family protein [Candidatus Aenigmarchaeota archaeon]|nr:aldehyde dehydrogenase family protein [Candidatus Aenigmarchaeota archaeon]